MGDNVGDNMGENIQNHENENPELVTSSFAAVTEFLQGYGWFMVAGGLLLLYAWGKLKPSLDRTLNQMSERREAANFDPARAQQKAESLEAVRRRMQEKHDADAARHKEIQDQKEEEKRKEKIEDWERHQRGGGYRNKSTKSGGDPNTSAPTSKPSSLPRSRPRRSNDFNPLLGGGADASYRPPRRGPTGGG